MTRKAPPSLTHLDEHGDARMVDVGDKPVTRRTAVASAIVRMQPSTRALLERGETPKGDVFATARIAGIQAAKRTSELIPLCHPLALSKVNVGLEYVGDDRVRIEATVSCEARTGVEMEALTAASVSALTLYDMLKAVDRGMVVERVALEEKHGGASGDYVRSEPATQRGKTRRASSPSAPRRSSSHGSWAKAARKSRKPSR